MSVTRLDGRKTAGRFQHGNPGGPGRPPRQTEAGYLLALMEECPLDTWREVVRAAVEAAKGGDDKARTWLSRYLVGSPEHQAPQPTTVIVQQLTGQDHALEKAALLISEPQFDALLCDPGTLEAARAAILEREAGFLNGDEAG